MFKTDKNRLGVRFQCFHDEYEFFFYTQIHCHIDRQALTQPSVYPYLCIWCLASSNASPATTRMLYCVDVCVGVSLAFLCEFVYKKRRKYLANIITQSHTSTMYVRANNNKWRKSSENTKRNNNKSLIVIVLRSNTSEREKEEKKENNAQYGCRIIRCR